MTDYTFALEHISRPCPYCHKDVSFSWVSLSSYGGGLSDYFKDVYENKQGAWSIGVCPTCKNCVLIKANYVRNKLEVTNISPLPLPNPTDERIPSDIRKALDEAKICLSVGAAMASSSMSRRAIQCACIKEGADKTKSLQKQIDELFEKGIITEQVKNWAHSVRWVGNDGSHPLNPEVTKEDAEDVLHLAEQLMNILYVMPAIAQRQKDSHGKKEGWQNNSSDKQAT